MAERGQLPIDHWLDWLGLRAPHRLDELVAVMGGGTARDALKALLAGSPIALASLAVAHGHATLYAELTAAMPHLLRRWATDLAADPTVELRWLDSDPGSSWRRIAEDQVHDVLLAADLPALRRMLATGMASFGSEQHRVRIFPRKPLTNHEAFDLLLARGLWPGRQAGCRVKWQRFIDEAVVLCGRDLNKPGEGFALDTVEDYVRPKLRELLKDK